jgi:hypothetical protein
MQRLSVPWVPRSFWRKATIAGCRPLALTCSGEHTFGQCAFYCGATGGATRPKSLVKLGGCETLAKQTRKGKSSPFKGA